MKCAECGKGYKYSELDKTDVIGIENIENNLKVLSENLYFCSLVCYDKYHKRKEGKQVKLW